MNTVRCKMRCIRTGDEICWSGGKHIEYWAQFDLMRYEGSESIKFWEGEPAGSIELNTLTEMPFKAGEDYYFDIHQ